MEGIHASESPRNHKVSWILFNVTALYLALAISGPQRWSVAGDQPKLQKTKHNPTICTHWAKMPDLLLCFKFREGQTAACVSKAARNNRSPARQPKPAGTFVQCPSVEAAPQLSR